MPTLNFNWLRYTPQNRTPYSVDVGGGHLVPANWIVVVQWRNAVGAQLPTSRGVYVIEGGVNTPVYAGQALNRRNRFAGRSDALHELGLTNAALPNYAVWTSSVVAVPAHYPNKVDWAEEWLVRFLFRRDQLPANAPPRLQNINLTAPFNAPADGLRIRFDPITTPAYLMDPHLAGWVYINANLVGYTYGPGVQLP